MERLVCLLCFPTEPPKVTAEPVKLAVKPTQKAQFACEAFGIPLPEIKWIKVSNNAVLSTSMDGIEITEMIMDSFTLVSTLHFLSTTISDQSEYTCVGSNNVTNIIGSPENDTVNLLVLGEFFCSSCSFHQIVYNNVYWQRGGEWLPRTHLTKEINCFLYLYSILEN